MIRELGGLRVRGIIFIAVGGWLATLALIATAIVLGRDALEAAFASALLNVLPTICAVQRRSDGAARMAVGIMASLQPAFMVYAVQSTGLQVDMHMYFFVAIAALTVLCDVRPIVAACTIVAVHHLILAYAAPSWVFAGSSTFFRVMIHAIAVAILCAILSYISLGLAGMLRRLDESRAQSEAQTQKLQKALQTAELERGQRRALEVKQTEERKADLAKISREFENSVSGVTHAVSATAKLLERTTKALDGVAHETGDRASDVAGSAEAATRAAQTVARGVDQLSGSIANIAVNVSQQKEMTSRATERSFSGGVAVGSLSERSDTIGEATRAIVRIAERTNLLSLNAAIEAASAGPAGRGFTIVAQEVKALAKQAAEAATEIDDLLSGVRSGTLEAEKNFADIDAAVADLDKAAIAIRGDVETQRQSADTIAGYARTAAEEVSDMADRSRSLAETAATAKQLAGELDKATSVLLENVKTLEQSTELFVTNLRAA